MTAPASLADYRVAVVGLGVMGRGIARVFAAAGADVVGTDATAEDVAHNAALMAAEAETDGDTATPRVVGDMTSCLTGAHLVIEAVSERPETKAELLEQLGTILGPDTIVATNTSSLSVSDLGRQYGRPERLVGMHFFNPATKMRLVEVVRGSSTAQETVDEALRLCERVGKVGVLCADSPGFVVNRCCRPLYYESQLLASHGVEPAVVDTLARRVLGHRMGPLETIDITGLHTHLSASETALREFGDPRYRPIPLVRRLVRAGLLGRSTGRGFYDYGTETPGAARRRVAVETESGPGTIAVAGPDADELIPLLGDRATTDIAADTRVTVYRTVEASDHDVDHVRRLAATGAAVVVDSSDGGWITRLPEGIGWARVHELDGELTTEVVVDELAGIERTVAVDALLATIGGVHIEVMALPGLVADRLGFALANEAFALVEEGIATADGVDAALVSGMNHARGPFAFVAAAGVRTVLHGLRRLQAVTGDDRYRPSMSLIRTVAGDLRRSSRGSARNDRSRLLGP